ARAVVRIYISFFFQAEDGIRDFHVTGVQTCALPILGWCPMTTLFDNLPLPGARHDPTASLPRLAPVSVSAADDDGWVPAEAPDRSEERRVGKEGSSRASAEAARKDEVRHNADA